MGKLVIPGGRRALPTPLTQAEKDAIAAGVDNAAIAAANTNAASIANLERAGLLFVNIYWSDQGDDANDGLVATEPVRTWQRVTEIFKKNRLNFVRCTGNLVFDYYFVGFDLSVQILNEGTSSIEAVASTNVPSRTGGLWLSGCSYVLWNGPDLDLNSTAGFGVFTCSGGVSAGNFRNSTVTQQAGNACFMFGAESGARLHFDVLSTPLTNVLGRVFLGVASGSDPNADVRYTSNLNSV